MREIVHIQAGQCGNQIGAKVWSGPGEDRGRVSIVTRAAGSRQFQAFHASLTRVGFNDLGLLRIKGAYSATQHSLSLSCLCLRLTIL